MNLKAPVVFLVEDNEYAISVPSEIQYPGGNVAELLKGYTQHGLLIIDEIDGCDPIASYQALTKAVNYTRARKGPALVRAKVIRPYSHSLSDDEQLYKTEQQRKEEISRDPFINFPKQILKWGDLKQKEWDLLQKDIDAEIQKGWDEACEAPLPAPNTF